MQDYESILKDRYELDEFGKGKYPFSNVPPTNYGVKSMMRHGDGDKEIEMVIPNEILPGDYICRVNDFEVNPRNHTRRNFQHNSKYTSISERNIGKKGRENKSDAAEKKGSHEHRKLEGRKNECSPLNDCSQPPPKPTTGTYV